MTSLVKSDSLTLWDLEKELVEAYQSIEAAETDEERLTALKVFDQYATSVPEKRDKCAQFISRVYNAREETRDEKKRLDERERRQTDVIERMEQYVLAVMERVGAKQLEGKLFTFKAKSNPPSAEITDELAIEPEYLVQPDPPPPKPDKRKALEQMKRGKEVAGFKLVQKKRLVIE